MKCFCAAIIILLSVSLAGDAKSQEYKAKGYVYIDLLGGDIGYPWKTWELRVGKMAGGIGPLLLGTSGCVGKYSDAFDEGVFSWLPLHVIYVPFVKIEPEGTFGSSDPICSRTVYAMVGWSNWCEEKGSYFDVRVGASYYLLNFNVGYMEARFKDEWSTAWFDEDEVRWHYDSGWRYKRESLFYVSAGLQLGALFPHSYKQVHLPRLAASISFDDAIGNRNGVLAGGEEAEIIINTRNEGKGDAEKIQMRLEIMDSEFAKFVILERPKKIKKLKAGESDYQRVLVKAKKGLPSGSFKLGLVGIDKKGQGISASPIYVSAERLKERPKYPADLVISNIHFFEPSGNKVLDGYETAKLGFTIENLGKGKAVSVKVELVPLLGGSNLSFERETEVGTIEPNSSRSVEITITAPYGVPSEEVKLRVEIPEKFGNDADPFIYFFETRAYQPPKLEVADVGIDDDREGDSQGDNDGIIEPGESIEVTCAIQNTGFGDAVDVKAKMIIAGEDVHYIGRDQYNLGDIPSGDYNILEFYFWIPKKYKEDNVPISVQLTEAKGRYGITEPLNLLVSKPSGYVKEITVARKEIEKPGEIKEVQLSIDAEEIPQNSLTKLENGLCVIFGIEDYKYAPKATFANRDAAIFHEYVKSVFGIPERNIYIRTNEGATKGEFDKVFAEKGWLAKRVEKGKSDIIFYFSGHGAPDIETKKPYLIPCDIDPNYASTAFPLDEIYENLSGLGAGSVTIFLDACFSGQSKEEIMLLADAKPLIPVEIEEPSGDITVFMASTGEQIASVHREKKHGLFTYYLLKGLQGYGDLNGDKDIRVRELSDYLKENVSKDAGFMDREQVPQLLSGDRERVLVKMR